MGVIVRLLLTLIDIYSMIIVVYCLMSWIPRGGSGFIEDVRTVLASICEPYLGLFRRIIPPFGMIDFSPIVAIIVLQVLRYVIIAIL
ncbi:MAG: YggT family protein [Coriobacteriales bacterium]|nr:YggT family protein [Coriobacteriales bacterium]